MSDLPVLPGRVELSPPITPRIVMGQPEAEKVLVVPVPGPRGLQGEPGLPGDAVALAGIHVQDSASSVWQWDNDLPFEPALISVVDDAGNIRHPIREYPGGNQIRLVFLEDVKGTARYS